jgi:signal transduction histidine kinase
MPSQGETSNAATKKRGLPALPALAPVFDLRRLRSVIVPDTRPGWLSGMRIRKKLLVLHTMFWLVLASGLLLTLHLGMQRVLADAETQRALAVLQASSRTLGNLDNAGVTAALERLRQRQGDSWSWSVGTSTTLGLSASDATRLIELDERGGIVDSSAEGTAAAIRLREGVDGEARFIVLRTQSETLRAQVRRLYGLQLASLLVVYGLVVLVLELFVLPTGVYLPLRRLLRADDAVKLGKGTEELIAEDEIPGDELGSIMRSRNETVTRLRTLEQRTNAALLRVEEIAGDLKRKNELLEAAQRNLADADRLAGLGVLSAGIAHELNTPLAVVKGLAEKMQRGATLSASEAALLVRVVGRLERLSEGLLDYARVRPPRVAPAQVRPLVDEAMTLVRLDRGASNVTMQNLVPSDLSVPCDADRITQVLVNLLRNSVDAMAGVRQSGQIVVRASVLARDGRQWASLTIMDDGPGIAPEVLARLFEPFVSTRLDAKGTGLGLAVAEGIVREHGGVLAAKNRTEATPDSNTSGAIFEVLLPLPAPGAAAGAPRGESR